MIPLVEQQLDAIRFVCRRHGVARLELFGSAANPAAFDSGRSDVDFIVSFRRGFDLGPWLAHYFDLRDELANLLQRPVEIVMESALRNPLFRREAGGVRFNGTVLHQHGRLLLTRTLPTIALSFNGTVLHQHGRRQDAFHSGRMNTLLQ